MVKSTHVDRVQEQTEGEDRLAAIPDCAAVRRCWTLDP